MTSDKMSMGKLQELKHLTWMTGVFALLLFAVNLHSMFDFKSVAQTTIGRIPASITEGIGASPAVEDVAPSIEKLEVSCDQILDHTLTALKVKSKKVQIQFLNCGDQLPLELINLTNGYQSTLFKSQAGIYSDLVSLIDGANEIHLRLEKVPTPLKLQILL